MTTPLTYQDEPRVEKLFNVCTGHLAATASESAQGAKADMKQQKRSYRVLEELFSSPNEACQNFMARNIKSIQDTFLQALSKASPSSQAYRLKCLVHIVRNLREDQSDFVHAVVPEAVLCIKATNEKARNSSYTLLVVIGEALQRWSSSSGQALIVVGKDIFVQICCHAEDLASPLVDFCLQCALTKMI